MEERARFATEYESGEWTMAELCRRYGIARKTGYKILARWEQNGVDGLKNLSRRPHHHSNQTSAEIEAQILEARRTHMRWGPRKLHAWLESRHPQVNWPVPSTIGELLRRAGLSSPPRVRRRTPPYTQPFASATAANEVWCMDFKGWFRTRDGARIDPFTMTDAHSRFLLRCQIVDKTDTASVQAICEAAFREFGLPRAIRSDNGAPFASAAVGGLSRLALYWMKLGILHERIKPGHPEQNGRHERMHRTLKQETANPPEANPRRQQQAFQHFLEQYNQQRPHEALDMKTPAAVYTTSPRPHPDRIPEPEYDSNVLVRGVYSSGEFFWKQKCIFISKVLAGERIGLEQIDDRLWCILFASFPIAYFDSQQLTVGPLP
jgi:transposase InsO family protein